MGQLFFIMGTTGALLLMGSIAGMVIYHRRKVKQWEQQHPLNTSNFPDFDNSTKNNSC